MKTNSQKKLVSAALVPLNLFVYNFQPKDWGTGIAVSETKYLIGNKKIVFNTLLLYSRSVIIMILSLFIVRKTLHILGVTDYGIFNIVAGAVSMLSFLTSSMATSSQRFFSYEIGKGNFYKLGRLFTNNMIIYIIFTFIIVLFGETVGLWFVKYKLVYPEEKTFDVILVYHFSIITLSFSILSTSYLSLLIAYEKMNYFAVISILDISLKLTSVFILELLVFENKLVIYSVSLSVVSFIVFLTYKFVCNFKYRESIIKFNFDKNEIKELISFISWNFFGSIAGLSKIQGTNILLNIFFGPIVNASKAISSQVNSAVVTFSQNFSTAIRPNIVKLYATDNDNTLRFVFFSCKITYFLMLIVSLPIILKLDFLLSFWLVNVPEHAVIFTSLVLIDSLIDSVSYPLMGLAQATGKIKLYQVLIGSLIMLNIPISYIFLKFNFACEIVFYIMLFITLIAFIGRLFIVKQLIHFSIKEFAIKVIKPILAVTFLNLLMTFFTNKILIDSICDFVLFFACFIVLNLFITFNIGFEKKDKNKMINYILGKIKRKIC